MSLTTILQPRLNEKTYGLSAKGVYVFNVDKSVNKHTVARAVEAQFEVKVAEVNIANIPGKAKRVVSLTGKRARNSEGHRSDIKKAYVTLVKGYSLPLFAAVEEEDKQEQAVQAKVEKAAEKAAAKDAKPARRGLRGTKEDK